MAKSRTLRCFSFELLIFATLFAAPALAQVEVCGTDVKEKVAQLVSEQRLIDADPWSPEALELQDRIYEQFAACAIDPAIDAATPSAVALPPWYCGKLAWQGSLSYERMPCCGYDPQKRLFGCPVEIRLPVGFGLAPIPGSREYVLTCVDFGGGFVPVAWDSVHLANDVSGSNPTWYFAVIANARNQLSRMPLKGQMFRARSILSWGLAPSSCNYHQIWGNTLEYQIRLDP